MAKDDILTRFKAKDYNNALEEILEKKEFSNDVKNLLLNMLYKVETGYNDYKKVKIDVLDKKIIIGEIINSINENCMGIKLITPKEKINNKNKRFKINYEDNSITTYPIERYLLRAVYNLSYQEVQTNGIEKMIKDSFSRFMNIAYSNDTYEIIRDFDGWNWSTDVNEIDNFEYNVVYQNLKILTNNEYLYKIKNNEDGEIDFDKNTRIELQKNIEKPKVDEFMKYFYKSILILNKHRYDEMEKMQEIKDEKEKELERLEDKERFIEELNKEEKKYKLKIKKIENILNDPKGLNEEFRKRNSELDDNSKIFSLSNLTEILVDEKRIYEKKIEKISEKILKEKYTEDEEKNKKILTFINDLDLESTFNKDKTLIKLQKIFLKCFMEFINKAENRKQVLELIYTLRYYCLIYYNNKFQIKDVKELKEDLNKIRKELILKSMQIKMFNELSINEDINLQIIEPIFELRNIDLDNIEIRISEDIVNNNKIKVEYLDNGISEETNEIKVENIRQSKGLKFNKKIKLFN